MSENLNGSGVEKGIWYFGSSNVFVRKNAKRLYKGLNLLEQDIVERS
jgi:hypothetical protein